MATIAKVHEGTLEMLGVLPLGGTVSATDTARMTRAYDQVYADLKAAGTATWASTDDVPNDAVPHVEALMAFNAADSYYIPDKRYQRILLKVKPAKRELRRLAVPDYESLDEVKDY
jgi:hypothetical protein